MTLERALSLVIGEPTKPDRPSGSLLSDRELEVGRAWPSSNATATRTPIRRSAPTSFYFAYYRDLHLASGKKSQMWLLEPDAAYAFPNDDGITLVLCMPARAKLPAFERDLEGSFARFIDGLPGRPDLAGAARVSKIMGATNLVNSSRPGATNGLAFVGDAALWSAPLWGVGCGWAFQSAEWLADETAPALTNGGDLDRALVRYREKHKKRLPERHRIVSDFSAAGPYNPIERLTFSAAARDERTARHFYSFGSRRVGARAVDHSARVIRMHGKGPGSENPALHSKFAW
jgi:2-polyprenyl-6-methoxyphenol hydroxylase-like FAD-dependent oxidoreductase